MSELKDRSYRVTHWSASARPCVVTLEINPTSWMFRIKDAAPTA
jgi:hypothetical protein